MTDREKRLIIQFSCGEISCDEFYSLLPQFLDMTYQRELYREAIAHKDSEGVCYLRMLPTSRSVQFEEIWKVLLAEDWHFEHEDLIGIFQYTLNRNKANVEFLLSVFRGIPLYISQDSVIRYSYLKKVIYAIGAQPQPESLNALEALLSETNDDAIRAMLSRQIEERRSLVGGRYEFEERGE